MDGTLKTADSAQVESPTRTRTYSKHQSTPNTQEKTDYYANPFCDEVVLPDGSLFIYDCEDPIIVTPQEDPHLENDDDGGGGGSWPSDDGDNCPTCGGTGGDGDGSFDRDLDICNQNDPPAYCQESEPCAGNPVKNPRIAEQTYSGVDGGRFGPTRNGEDPMHWGLDVINDIGSPFYSSYTGNVDARGYEANGLGYFVTIRFQVNGVYYIMRYGHLKEEGRPSNGADINAGDVIGFQGLSGNLKTAILDGYTNDPHSHIMVGERTGTGWNHEEDYTRIDPEDFITTKFDSNGNPIAGTDC